jgi:hypothetical protein
MWSPARVVGGILTEYKMFSYSIYPVFRWLINKAGHEPARAGLGASQHLARCKWARLGLAHFANEPENWARPELAYGSVQLDQVREPWWKKKEQKL